MSCNFEGNNNQTKYDDIMYEIVNRDIRSFHMQEMLETLRLIGHEVDDVQMSLLKEIYECSLFFSIPNDVYDINSENEYHFLQWAHSTYFKFSSIKLD